MEQLLSEKTKTILLVVIAVSLILVGVYLRDNHGSAYGLVFVGVALSLWLRFGRD